MDSEVADIARLLISIEKFVKCLVLIAPLLNVPLRTEEHKLIRGGCEKSGDLSSLDEVSEFQRQTSLPIQCKLIVAIVRGRALSKP